MDPISTVTTNAKAGFNLGFVVKVLVAFLLIFAFLDLIGSFFPTVRTAVMNPYSFIKSKFGTA